MNESSKPPNGAGSGSEDSAGGSGDPEIPVPSPTSPERKSSEPKPHGSTRFGREDVEDSDSELGGRMTFLEHLDELRRRILRSVLAVIVTFVVAWIFHEEIYHFISVPILNVVDRLVVIKPTEPFTIYLKVSFMAAVFLAAPFILGQVWLFVAPGLYRNEKRFAMPFLFGSTVLFVLGGLFAYYVVLPPALNFLLVQFGKEFQPMITAVEYYDFALIIILGMGVIFQMPILVAFLSIFGMVTPGFLWRNFRYAFLIIVIIAAIVSPTTDAFNLFLWSGPMIVLYTVSIGVSWVFQRRRKKQEQS